MKTRAILLLLAVVLVSCATPSSFACSQPGTTTLLESWPGSSLVGYVNNNVPAGPVTTAINNWNAGLVDPCTPTLVAGGSNIVMNFASLPAPTPCPAGSTCFTRGSTDFTRATFTLNGRLSSVPITINSSMTNTAAITEVVAHELGHTFALADCNYPGCPVGSSVMESAAAATSINSVIGQPGPTTCDMTAVMTFNADYTCSSPPPPGPPMDCSNNPCDPELDPSNPCCSVTPIIIDTSGQGFYLTDAQNGVLFDMRGTGKPIQMAWTALGADNAFLALPGADGLVHSGQQLFGNFTPQPKSTTPNGFAALAVYDDPKNGGNGDGVIDSKDAIFSSLRLWIDANHDGIAQPDEIHTLPELGVTSISLDYHEDKRRDQYGNLFRYRAKVNPDDPDISHVGRIAYDVFLVVQSTSNTAKKMNPAGATCQVPTKKVGMLAPVSSLR